MYRLSAFHHGQRVNHEFVLVEGRTYVLGRGEDCDLIAAWDPQISRRHIQLTCTGQRILIQRLPTAANAVFVDGQTSHVSELATGQCFVIGCTRFDFQQLTLADSPGMQPARPVQQLEIDRRQLQRVRYDDAARRIEVLTSLPAVIRESSVERDLHLRLAGLLLAGIQNADGVAIVGVSEQQSARVFHQELRFDGGLPLQPSTRLMTSALQQQKTILHIWDEAAGSTAYTQAAGFAWAFCTPFSDLQGERGLYITGRTLGESGSNGLERVQADIKFTEFVADVIGALQRQRRLERQQAGLRQFFSPPILEALGRDLDTSLLEPRECDVTVLFCDLRGFSHQVEEQAHDLKGVLERVSLADPFCDTLRIRSNHGRTEHI